MTAVREPVARAEVPPRRRQPWLSKKRLPYVLIVPAIIFELFIHVIPLLAGVGISFLGLTQFFIRNWTLAPFVGVDNYRKALDFGGPIGEGLVHSFAITVAFTLIVVAASYGLGLYAAQLVNTEFRGQRWFRTLFLVPYAMPVYVAVIAWSFMLDRDNGALNALLSDLHVVSDPLPFWLIGRNAFWAIVMTTVWRLWPFAFLMVLAGLQNIPDELHEAAAVDGATPFERFRHITLPLLRPVTSVVLIILFLWTFNEFNTAYVLFGPAPPESADLLSLHIYVNSFVNLNFGLGSAMSVLLLLFLLVVTMTYVRVFHVGVSAVLRDRSLRGRITHAVGLAILTFVTVFPLYTIIITSLKPLADVRSEFQWIPSNLTFQPYIDIWSTVPLAHYFVNSLIVAVSATVISVTVAIFAAYAISRYRFRGRGVFNVTVLSTQMFPGILFLLPLFVIFVNIERSFGITLYGTYIGLIITYLTFSLPFSIWMLVGYFNSIPRELEEAALTEGATPIGALFRILIPISVPGIAAVAIYAFITAWGEVLFASVLTTDETRTLAIGLRNYSSQTNVYWNQLMAAAIVVSAPVVIAFLAAQKWIVRGLTAGGVK